MNKIEKAKRTRKVLDWTMYIFAALLGGFLFTVFVIAVVNLTVNAWTLGLGIIPMTLGALALFLLVWGYFDKKTDDILEEGENLGKENTSA